MLVLLLREINDVIGILDWLGCNWDLFGISGGKEFFLIFIVIWVLVDIWLVYNLV